MPGLGGSGAFRRARLDSPRPARSKPLEKSEQEKRWLSKTPEHSGTLLGRRNFKAAPKPPELPSGFIYARAAAVKDIIGCQKSDGDIVIAKVVAHRQSDGMVLCRNVATGEKFVVGGDVIVELGI